MKTSSEYDDLVMPGPCPKCGSKDWTFHEADEDNEDEHFVCNECGEASNL